MKDEWKKISEMTEEEIFENYRAELREYLSSDEKTDGEKALHYTLAVNWGLSLVMRFSESKRATDAGILFEAEEKGVVVSAEEWIAAIKPVGVFLDDSPMLVYRYSTRGMLKELEHLFDVAEKRFSKKGGMTGAE